MTTWADEDDSTGSPPRDPYQTLGVASTVSDVELRRAYHRLAKLHHPDHNGGSPLASRRFAEIQLAYDTIVSMRRGSSPPTAAAPTPSPAAASGRFPPAGRSSPRHAWAEPWLDERISDLERSYQSERPASQYGAAPRATPRPSEADSLRRSLTDLFRNA